MDSLRSAQWRTSSYTNSDGGNCVEVAVNLAGVVAVRDTKDRGGPVLVFSRGEWKDFLVGIKSGGVPSAP